MNEALLVGKSNHINLLKLNENGATLKRKRVVYVISPQTVHTVHNRKKLTVRFLDSLG